MWRGVQCLAVFVLSIAIFWGNGSRLQCGDTVPARLFPLSLILEGNIHLDEFEAGILPDLRYSLLRVDGHTYSAYPLGSGFSALPVYAFLTVFRYDDLSRAMELAGQAHSERRRAIPLCRLTERWEALAAAVIAACSVLGIWVFARSVCTGFPPVLITVAFACGTSIMSSSSQALWTHGPAAAAMVWALCLLCCPGRVGAWRLSLAGALFAWAVFCRPTNVVPLGAFSLWVLYRHRVQSVWFIAFGMLVFGLTHYVNFAIYGDVFGGYSSQKRGLGSFDLEAFAGLLLSPSRGLFVFSPVVLAGFCAGVKKLVRQPLSYAAGATVASLATVLLHACWRDWTGGYSFGPRLLGDILPLLFLPLIDSCVVLDTHRRYRAVFVFLMVFSCVVHWLGAYQRDGRWTESVYKGVERTDMWDIMDSQLAWTLCNGPPRGYLLHDP